jgi:hypothetical protein
MLGGERESGRVVLPVFDEVVLEQAGRVPFGVKSGEEEDTNGSQDSSQPRAPRKVKNRRKRRHRADLNCQEPL